MIWEGREVRSRMDYILGKDCCLICNVSIWDPRHNLDHYLVPGCLRGTPMREHSKYLRRHKRTPLRPLTTLTREDGLFAALRRAVPNPKAKKDRKNAWILATMWRIVDERVSTRREPARDHTLKRRLVRTIDANLKGDWKRREEEADEEVESLL